MDMEIFVNIFATSPDPTKISRHDGVTHVSKREFAAPPNSTNAYAIAMFGATTVPTKYAAYKTTSINPEILLPNLSEIGPEKGNEINRPKPNAAITASMILTSRVPLDNFVVTPHAFANSSLYCPKTDTSIPSII